jgi:hypothetical protein
MGHFRDDLDKHIAKEHFNMCLHDFKNLNIYECDKCDKKADIINFQKYACRRSELSVSHKMEQPWTEVSFSEFCNEFLRLKEILSRSKCSQNTVVQPSIIERQPIEQTDHIESTSYTIDDRTRSDCYTVLVVMLLLFLFICTILADY